MSLELSPSEVDLVPPHACAPLPEAVLYVMAAACGTAAANIYYNSPLLDAFRVYFGGGRGHAEIDAKGVQQR